MKARESHLKHLDYSVLQQCMHCGLCLPTCPTYDATKLERHGPRGRISLMRAIADEQLQPSTAFGEEMYFCLGCLACMSACPAGVDYATLFEHARAEVEETRLLRSWRRALIRQVTVRWLFMDLGRLHFLGVALRLYQQLGIQQLLRRSGVLRLLPRRLQELESITPDVEPSFSAELIPPRLRARGRRRFRVALLTGCAHDLVLSQVNRDTAEVLTRNGCEVVTPPDQFCCGSLHAHNGEWELAKQLARQQLTLIPPGEFDAIITNAGGCGSHLKHYAKLLVDDHRFRDLALLWDRKVRDIHEWLDEIGIEPPSLTNPPVRRVTYHESCHLAHGQRITAQPRRLLSAIPGLQLAELNESAWCCGSAGIYNLTQPEMAGRLQDRKIRQIAATGALTVAVANPGCHLQILNGLRSQGLAVRVAHPITLLAEAYRAEDDAPAKADPPADDDPRRCTSHRVAASR